MPRARSRSALSRLCGLAMSRLCGLAVAAALGLSGAGAPTAAAAPARATVHPGDAAATTCPRPKVMRRREVVYGQDPVNKLVAITFDDGPHPTWTPRVLDVLRRYHVKATFFVLGVNAERYPALVARIRREGHTVANHTYTHIDTSGAGPKVASQLDRTQAAIKKATNFTPCLFRPPYGAKSNASVALTRRKGMQTVLWDVDTSDYERPASFDIVQRVLTGVKPGSIVLMHDGGGPREETLGALPEIIKGLKAKGYRFVTLNKLLKVRERYA